MRWFCCRCGCKAEKVYWVIRRGIEPAIGKLAIVGGFVDEGETWQGAGAREVLEETAVVIGADTITPMWFTSTQPRPNRVLLFGIAESIDGASLPAFAPTNETTERGLVFGPEGLDETFAFPLHVEAAQRYFAARGVKGPHDYVNL